MNIDPATVIRPSIPYGPRTAVVIGSYRGGTSYIAQLLACDLSLPMGITYNPADAADYSNYEDLEIANVIDKVSNKFRHNPLASPDWPTLVELIKARDVKHPVIWGFKKPATVFIIDQLLPLLRNPHLLVVLRDPLAIWQSDVARQGTNGFWCSARHHLGCVMDLLEKPRGPTLAISYERAKSVRKITRNAIADFLGVKKDEQPNDFQPSGPEIIET